MSKEKKIYFEPTFSLRKKQQVIGLLFRQMLREVLEQGADKSEKMEISDEETLFQICVEYVRELIMFGCDNELEEIEEEIQRREDE